MRSGLLPPVLLPAARRWALSCFRSIDFALACVSAAPSPQFKVRLKFLSAGTLAEKSRSFSRILSRSFLASGKSRGEICGPPNEIPNSSIGTLARFWFSHILNTLIIYDLDAILLLILILLLRGPPRRTNVFEGDQKNC